MTYFDEAYGGESFMELTFDWLVVDTPVEEMLMANDE